ncbi:MAG: hypothetical protein M3252_01240 [Actinomycetota bacterium]|nr:hypothetical protein [Actinomycetota bacterium]
MPEAKPEPDWPDLGTVSFPRWEFAVGLGALVIPGRLLSTWHRQRVRCHST